MVIHSTFPDFILFLYVHMAHVDNTYDPKELSAIKNKMARLFPDGTDLEKKLYQTIREYNSFDKSKINELCKDSFAFFNELQEAQSTGFFDDAQAIIDADGQIQKSEAEALQTLRKFMDKHGK
ncbi:MAG TPA: hypothetical protein VD884_12200 [Ohtaekwangia sp.]|nr:hypothetical protein [Ohtaekwangia sp.]